MNLRRVTTVVLTCIMQHCFALAEQILVEKDEKNEGNHIGHNSKLSLPAVNSKIQGDVPQTPPTTSIACSSRSSGDLTFFGYGPNCELQECGGHCNSNSDCASGLFCLPSDGKDNRVVPGCLTVPYKDVNYCVSKKFQPKPNARHGTPNRVLLEEKIDDIKPGRYIIKSIYGTSICIKDNVKLVEDI